MKYISLFSGIEAATAAWHPLGWEPLFFCEIEDFPERSSQTPLPRRSESTRRYNNKRRKNKCT